MSYRPKAGEAKNLENLVSKRIDEILSSVKGVSNVYVEPGDVVVITVPDGMEEEAQVQLKKLMAAVFNGNKGVILTEGIKIEVAKNAESGEEVRQLKAEINRLKADIESLRSLIERRNSLA